MATANKSKNDLSSDQVVEPASQTVRSTESPVIDSQVKIPRHYATRRSYDTAYKLRILSAYDACENSLDRGALLRKEGLYYSRIHAWKKQLENSKLSGRKKTSHAILRNDYLARENEQLKKKLAQAEAIIDLQKKVSELLGTHILPHKDSEAKS
jgi:transposase